MNTNVIMTKGLTKEYGGVRRVNGVDLNVKEGEIYGFLGPNGAGKSTTLKMILGLAKATQGEITLFGKQLCEKNRISILEDVGSLIESPSYYGHLTGYENLKVIAALLDVPDKNIHEVLKIVRLENQKDKRAEHYSLGMKQRLGLAMALLRFPKLLILDEPTNGLDPAGIGEVRELILSLPKKYEMTVLVSSHLLNEIDQIASFVGIIDHGRLVFEDSMHKLREMGESRIAFQTDHIPFALQLFSQQGIPVTQEGEYLVTNGIISERSIISAGHTLCREGIGILRIEERKKSLEDIFLELTERGTSL